MNNKHKTILSLIIILVSLIVLVGVNKYLQETKPLVPNVTSSPTITPIITSGTSPKPPEGSVSRYKTFAEVPQVPEGKFKYGGSTTWATIRRDIDSEIQKAFPNFKLEYINPKNVNPGSESGIKAMLGLLDTEARLTFSQSSRPFTGDEYDKATKQEFLLKQIPVAIDGIVVAVNPNLDIPGLTIRQIKDIYQSRITNWKTIGGPDQAIKPYSRRQKVGGTVKIFMEDVLENEDFGKTVNYKDDTTTALQQVIHDIGSIYYASAPEVIEQCNIKALPLGYRSNRLVSPYQEPLIPHKDCSKKLHNRVNVEAFRNKQYPLTRKLYVIVKEDHPDQKAGEAYARLLKTQQGQELLEKIGYASIY